MQDSACGHIRFGASVLTTGATIREGLLAAVVDHLLELDVEIRWQDISERPGASSMSPICLLHVTASQPASQVVDSDEIGM